MSFPLQVFPLIFGVTTEEEALDGAFFVGIQRVVAIRTGFSGLIPVARALMAAIPVSHFLSERPFEGQKIAIPGRRKWQLWDFSIYLSRSIPLLNSLTVAKRD